MTRYRNLKSFVDLHLLDRVRNHDKVYHLAVFEREDGCFDVLYRYGRRGKTLRLGMLKGGENIRNYQTAMNLMTKKEIKQVTGDGYQNVDGITPDVWNDLLPKSSSPEVASREQQPFTQPEPTAPALTIGGNGPKTWFW